MRFALSMLVVFVASLSLVACDGVCVNTGFPSYNSTVSDAFRAKVLTQDFSLDCDPYTNSTCLQLPYPLIGSYAARKEGSLQTAVCGVTYLDRHRETYRLDTFASAALAEHHGAYVTHLTACGACSSLQDLGVYMSSPNLETPSAACGQLTAGLLMQGTAYPTAFEQGVECLQQLGFTYSCSAIYLDDALNTFGDCATICQAYLQTPPAQRFSNNQTTCALNPCLQCDENLSGTIFKIFAGRSRRNSGLVDTIYRPPNTVADITHDYY